MSNHLKLPLNFLKKEPLFCTFLVLTLIASFFSAPHVSAIKWEVLSTLFSLMLVCAAFEDCHLLSSLAGFATGLFQTQRKLGLALIAVTGLLAMFVTNDVALLTVVPLTLTIALKIGQDPFLLIILETMSANLFSALTPFGNPQNLYLYAYYKIPASRFFGAMLPFCLLGGLILVLLNQLLNSKEPFHTTPTTFKITNYRLFLAACAAFVLNILAVLRILDYRLALFATLILLISQSVALLARVDYLLLLTFVCFFLFTNEITGIPLVQSAFSCVLTSGFAILFYSAGISQVLSNVPAAVLVSAFTPHYVELLYGVSAGGLGTPIASLASLISYKLYAQSHPTGKYLRVFLVLNFAVLLFLLAIVAGALSFLT